MSDNRQVIYEVVDRLSGRRWMEHVHLTEAAAHDWVMQQTERMQNLSRVQEVVVYCNHDRRCCRYHGTHTDPHRGCILR